MRREITFGPLALSKSTTSIDEWSGLKTRKLRPTHARDESVKVPRRNQAIKPVLMSRAWLHHQLTWKRCYDTGTRNLKPAHVCSTSVSSSSGDFLLFFSRTFRNLRSGRRTNSAKLQASSSWEILWKFIEFQRRLTRKLFFLNFVTFDWSSR